MSEAKVRSLSLCVTSALSDSYLVVSFCNLPDSVPMAADTFQDGIEKNGIFIDPNFDSSSEGTEGTQVILVKIMGFTPFHLPYGSPTRRGR